jgi:hypothetical protein
MVGRSAMMVPTIHFDARPVVRVPVVNASTKHDTPRGLENHRVRCSKLCSTILYYQKKNVNRPRFVRGVGVVISVPGSLEKSHYEEDNDAG